MRHLRPALICLLVLLLPAGCRRLLRDGQAVPRDSPAATAVPERVSAPGGGSDRAAPPPGDRVTIESGFAAVVDRVAGAVVNISTTRVIHPPTPEQMPFFDDPLFRELFGHGQSQMPRERREQALGSGVIVSRDGYVLTNVHVVQGSSDIRVSLPDKRELKAQIVGQDPKTDIALLRIPGAGFPFLQLGDSSKVRVGDFVLAIGDPLGLGQTVTMGIISAKGRGPARDRRLRRLHPDRRRHQPGQFRGRWSTCPGSSSASTPPSPPAGRGGATRGSASPCPPTWRAR